MTLQLILHHCTSFCFHFPLWADLAASGLRRAQKNKQKLRPVLLHLPRPVYTAASPMAQSVKNLLAIQETQVPSLGREGPLEKGMAIHSSILAWEIPWTEEPGGLQPIASQKSWTRLSDWTTASTTLLWELFLMEEDRALGGGQAALLVQAFFQAAR